MRKFTHCVLILTKEGGSVIKSMTGYGRSQMIINGRDILVEIRSVNHRYYEYNSRVPRTYNYIDEKLKALLKSGISRGKVDVSVSINNIEGRDTEIAINKGVADGYVKADRASVANPPLSMTSIFLCLSIPVLLRESAAK